MDRVYADGGTTIKENVSTTLIPAGGSAIVEFKVEVPGELTLVDHSIFRAFNKGAIGILEVGGEQTKESLDVFHGTIDERPHPLNVAKEIDGNVGQELSIPGSESGNAGNEAVAKIELLSTDQMRFNKREITVKAGQRVQLTLKHTGKLPKTVMGHNFVLLKKGVDVNGFVRKAIDFPNNDYVPTNSSEVIAYTKIIGGGESASIEFDAPAPGTYTFICSFPGHYAMMRGTFVVE
jgi:azurin